MPSTVSGHMWYVDDNPHLAALSSEQARLVKTVKVHRRIAEVLYGSDRRLPLGASPLVPVRDGVYIYCLLVTGYVVLRDRYRLGHRSVISLR